MGDLREIVDLHTVQTLFIVLALLCPVAGALIGTATARGADGARRGFVIGLVGPLNLALWFIYNAVTERLGLDTVLNLAVNLVLFVCVGGVIGWAVGRYSARPHPATAQGAPIPEVTPKATPGEEME